MEAKGLLLPLPESVQKILTQLLGKAVTVKKIPTGQVNTDKPGVVADYVFDTGNTGALALCDLGMANFAGAALMLLPPAATISDVKYVLDDGVVSTAVDGSTTDSGRSHGLYVRYVALPRPSVVRVRWTALDGTAQEEEFAGLWATCVQHEIDHLEGRLFIDYLGPLRRQMITRKMEKLKRERARGD